MKKLILFLCAVFLALTMHINAQTSDNLRHVLGKPATEIYKIKPDISVTVNYGSQGQICDIQLTGSYLPTWIADELVPLKSRGRQLSLPVSLISAMDCCVSWAHEYEKLTMVTSRMSNQSTIRYVFKGTQCVVEQPPIRAPLPKVVTQIPSISRVDLGEDSTNKFYGKYETSKPAVILELPLPELTPEIIASPAIGEMIIEGVLQPSGEITNIVFRGNLKKGMSDRASVAFRKIKFKPAFLNGKPVPQRIYIRYSLQKCGKGKICSRAVEILDS
jgi:hypothetical protein